MNPLQKTSKLKLRWLSMLLIAGVSTSASALLVPAQQDKLIGVRATNSQLSVDVSPIKDSFAVNEKIRLRAKGNQPYYLYLFNVDPQTGKAIMILPNKLQRNNYYGQQGYIVPNRDIEFYSDREGGEQMIMVASTKALNVELDKYKYKNNFAMGKSAQFEKSLGIRFNAPKQEKVNPNIVVKTFNVNIAGKNQGTETSFFGGLFGSKPAVKPVVSIDNNAPVAFVSTALNQYNAGEQFNLIFGANQAGYVHLYSIDPSGSYDLLKVAAVDGKTIKTLKIKAGAPYGRHTLVALFDKKQQVNYKSLGNITFNADKSLYVIEKSKKALAIHQIMINQPSYQ